MSSEPRIISTDEEIKIFTDPYRMKILEAYHDSENSLTVKGVADILGEVPAKVHYHVKKLISINVLTLDHIEVINGINAKYYKLVNEEFRVQLDKNKPISKNLDQLDKITTVIFNTIDEFKNDIYKRSQELKDEKVELTDDGFLTRQDIYLSLEEYDELEKHAFKMMRNKKNPNRKKYSVIVGVVGKE